MRKFAEVLVRSVAKAHMTDLELITPDTVRWAVYPDGNERKILYLLNCDPDLPQAVRVKYHGGFSNVILLDACEFKTVYVDSDIMFMPESSPTLLQGKAGEWSLDTNEQNVELENLSGSRKEIFLNGVTVLLEPSERKKILCPARIPEEKSEFLDPDYLSEPKIKLQNRSTPY